MPLILSLSLSLSLSSLNITHSLTPVSHSLIPSLQLASHSLTLISHSLNSDHLSSDLSLSQLRLPKPPLCHSDLSLSQFRSPKPPIHPFCKPNSPTWLVLACCGFFFPTVDWWWWFWWWLWLWLWPWLRKKIGDLSFFFLLWTAGSGCGYGKRLEI